MIIGVANAPTTNSSLHARKSIELDPAEHGWVLQSGYETVGIGQNHSHSIESAIYKVNDGIGHWHVSCPIPVRPGWKSGCGLAWVLKLLVPAIRLWRHTTVFTRSGNKMTCRRPLWVSILQTYGSAPSNMQRYGPQP